MRSLGISLYPSMFALLALQYLTIDMQRRPEQFQDLTEENIRDRMLVPLNTVFKVRGHAESKNRKGKTDILVRTKDNLNEHIFERISHWLSKQLSNGLS